MHTIAAIQMASTSEINSNIELCEQLIENAVTKKANIVVLPENFATLGLSAEKTFLVAEEFSAGPLQQKMKELAQKHKIVLIGGTIPLLSPEKNKIYSSCLVWDPIGTLIARYDKIHLFDVRISAKDCYQESKSVLRGNKIVVVNTAFGKIGLAICYDVRFPELFRALVFQGAEIIVLPSAFTPQTGKAHWEVLLRARAIENLRYMVAPDQSGDRSDGRTTYGHSMIIGPWGEILTQAKDKNEAIITHLKLDALRQLRQEFPVLEHCYHVPALAKPINEEIL